MITQPWVRPGWESVAPAVPAVRCQRGCCTGGAPTPMPAHPRGCRCRQPVQAVEGTVGLAGQVLQNGPGFLLQLPRCRIHQVQSQRECGDGGGGAGRRWEAGSAGAPAHPAPLPRSTAASRSLALYHPLPRCLQEALKDVAIAANRTVDRDELLAAMKAAWGVQGSVSCNLT